MPRKKLIRQNDFPYHVTRRTNNGDWFSLPRHIIWDYIKESFLYAQKHRPVVIHAFVLMDNHYHLLLTTPNCDIDEFMMYLNRDLSLRINKKLKMKNHRFSNSYTWTIVDHQSHLMNAYNYIYQNPVVAKITDSAQAWPYSSLHFSSFESKKFNFKPHFHYSYEKQVFEKKFNSDHHERMRKAFRRSKTSIGLK